MMQIEMMDGGILSGYNIEVFCDTVLVDDIYNVPLADIRRITIKEG